MKLAFDPIKENTCWLWKSTLVYIYLSRSFFCLKRIIKKECLHTFLQCTLFVAIQRCLNKSINLVYIDLLFIQRKKGVEYLRIWNKYRGEPVKMSKKSVYIKI